MQEIINFTKQLVATPSQNGIDLEKNVAQLVFDKLQSFGFEPKIIGPDEHPSIICYIKKENSTKTIWLESCLDTIPVGDTSKWEYLPFEAKIVGNKMFGRGTADAKVAIAIFCHLAKEFSEDKNFNGSIFLGFDADEQGGNFSGIREVVKHAPKVDVCILGYQGMNEIAIGSRGDLRLKLTTLGKSAHTGSRSKKGINAIHSMGKVISVLTSIDFKNKSEPFFEFGPTLNVAQINGGIAINVVPDKCEIKIDIRLVPSLTKEEVLNRINQELEKIKKDDGSFDYAIEIMQHYQPFLTDSKNEFVRILQNTAEDILKKKLPLRANGQRSVGNVINPLGVPVINAFGVEDGNVHAPNEWINIDTIPKVYGIYKKSLIEFCK